MTAIGFDLPAEITDIVAGLERFVRTEVIARHEKHGALLDDPRQRYGPDGRHVPKVVDLIRGGMGLTNELGLVHAYNTLRIINIADGTNEILRRTTYQQLAKGDVQL